MKLFALFCVKRGINANVYGEQALKLLKAGEKFDLVTSDIINAPMGGVTFLERLKNEFPEVPVLIITATHAPSVASECHTKGACGFLFKPFESQQLLQAVRDIGW